MTGPVRATIEDGVARIVLDDPDRKNAYTPEMKEGILAALDEIDRSGARCIVLEGAGDAFCAGGDVDRMADRAGGDGVPLPEIRGTLERSNEIVTRLATHALPVVALIDGPAAGGGAALAVAADVRLASERARIGFTFRQVGLTLDGGASFHLPRIVGVDAAAELALTGRMVDAEEALDLGLVHRCFPVGEFECRAAGVVADLADGPTTALGLTKRLLARGTDRTLEEALEAELLAQYAAANTRDHREGVAAFLEDRDPEFVGE